MKTLKDVYIEVTDKNKEEIKQIIGFRPCYEYVCFEWDGLDSAVTKDDIGLKQKVSLSQLKKLIETIPTREEITRLKRQISAYKTNYDKVVKHSLSKEDVIENIQNNNSELIQKLVNANKGLKSKYSEVHKLKEDIKKIRCERDSLDASYKSINEMYDDLVLESGKKQNLLKNLYDDALIKIDKYEEQKKVTDNIIHSNHAKIDHLKDRINVLIFDLNRTKERLKNKKWYQIWK